MIRGMHEQYEPDVRPGSAVVTLRGELDAHDAPRLRELFACAVSELDASDGAPRLVLDLTGVAFLDSTALGTMIGALRRVREAGGELRLVLPETPARRIFEITGLEQVLVVRATRAEALAD
jgi:anti-sigma B factor antagonist